MKDFPFDIVLFDLDGTLVDTVPDIALALNHGMQLHGLAPFGETEVRGMVGGGLPSLVAKALEIREKGTENRQKTLDAVRQFYEANVANQSRPYEGVLAALSSLRELGASLAVTTNKPERPALLLLEALEMGHFFRAVIGGDTLTGDRKKPAPDMLREAIGRCGRGQAVLVGDSRFDAEAAVNAGIPCVLYTPGYRNEPLAGIPHALSIDHFGELVAALETLAPPS